MFFLQILDIILYDFPMCTQNWAIEIYVKINAFLKNMIVVKVLLQNNDTVFFYSDVYWRFLK